jgi:hypothetical protein
VINAATIVAALITVAIAINTVQADPRARAWSCYPQDHGGSPSAPCLLEQWANCWFIDNERKHRT